MKATHLFIIIGVFLLFGCLDGNKPDNLYNYKNVTVARDSIPEKCWDLEDCEMFACMVELCWCVPNEFSGQPNEGIIYKSGIKVESEESAKTLVADYLKSISFKYGEITKIVKLNAIFYNVYYEPGPGDEEVLTVAVDGTILKTACGV